LRESACFPYPMSRATIDDQEGFAPGALTHAYRSPCGAHEGQMRRNADRQSDRHPPRREPDSGLRGHVRLMIIGKGSISRVPPPWLFNVAITAVIFSIIVGACITFVMGHLPHIRSI
jgi:hypothetical protein